MDTNRFNVTAVFVLCFALGCHPQPTAELTLDLELEKEKILSLHRAQRDYHFNKDSVSFVDQLSKNFTSVNRGQVTNPTREQTLSRYHAYFSSVEFLSWDDQTEPLIVLSEDGSMAYTVVDKLVRISYKDQDGNDVLDENRFAWTAIYKKYGADWKVDCVTSTDRPQN